MFVLSLHVFLRSRFKYNLYRDIITFQLRIYPCKLSLFAVFFHLYKETLQQHNAQATLFKNNYTKRLFNRQCKGHAYTLLCHKVLCFFHTEPSHVSS